MRDQAAAQVISVNLAHKHYTAEDVLAVHFRDGYWWSSKNSWTFRRGEIVFVRDAGKPGNQIVGRARIRNPEPVRSNNPYDPEVGLIYRYEVEFLNEKPIRGVFLRDHVAGGHDRSTKGYYRARSRQGVTYVTRSEKESLDRALGIGGGQPRSQEGADLA